MAAPTFIQKVGATRSGQAASYSQTLTVTSGNLIIACANCWQSLGRHWNDTSCDSSPALTWTRRDGHTTDTGVDGVWTAVATASGSITVTVTPNSSDWIALSLIEASFLGTLTFSNVSPSTSLSGAVYTTPSISPATGALLVAMFGPTFDPTSITLDGLVIDVWTDPAIADTPSSTVRRDVAAGTFSVSWTVGTNPGAPVADGVLVAIEDSGGQIARPISDISAGAWLPSSGSTLFSMIDEAVADDADYIYSD